MTQSLSKKCQLEGCNNDGKIILGYCRTHYMTFRRKGWVSLETRLTPNTYRTVGEVTYIGLRDNKGTITSEAIIDTEDIDKVNDTKWYQKENKYVYGLRNNRRRYLHRTIMDTPSHLVVNHWNSNPLDCRKSNLSNCTQAENSLYKRKYRGKYPYKGISYRSDCINKWSCRLSVFSTRIDMGQYKTMEEAAYVYDQVIMQLSGEFALTNFDWD